jgi:hypothetical protein
MSAPGGREVLEAIEEEHRRLWRLVAGRDWALLSQRPTNGQWSIAENLRHLLFAEQAHLGQFIPGGPQWSPFIIPPPGLQSRPEFSALGTAEPSSMAELQDVWASAHSPAREFLLADSEQVRKALQTNLRHLRNHIRIIERQLRRLARTAGV